MCLQPLRVLVRPLYVGVQKHLEVPAVVVLYHRFQEKRYRMLVDIGRYVPDSQPPRRVRIVGVRRRLALERSRMALGPCAVLAIYHGGILAIGVMQHAQEVASRACRIGVDRKRHTSFGDRLVDPALLEEHAAEGVVESGVPRSGLQPRTATIRGFVVTRQRFQQQREIVPGLGEFRS